MVPPSSRPLPCAPTSSSRSTRACSSSVEIRTTGSIEWISLTDDSSTTLDEAHCEHLQGALTIDADPEGRLYVLSERLRRLTLLDARGAVQSVLPWAMPGDPISIHCLDSHSFLIGTWKPGGLYLLDHGGHVLWSWTPGSTILAEARAAAAGPDGTYYVADASLHRIVATTPSQHVVRQFGIAGSPGYGPCRFANPSMLEVDADGGVLVCDTRNHRVVKIAADGSVAWEWPRRDGVTRRPTQLSMPWCARRLPDGGFAIADTYNFRVLQLDQNLEILRALGSCPIRPGACRCHARLSGWGAAATSSPTRTTTGSWRRTATLALFGTLGAEPPKTSSGHGARSAVADGRTVIADSRNDRILARRKARAREGHRRDHSRLGALDLQRSARRPDNPRRTPHRRGHREQSHRRARHRWRVGVDLPFSRCGCGRLAIVGSPQRQPRRPRAPARLGHRQRPRRHAGAPVRADHRAQAPLLAGRRCNIFERASGLQLHVWPLLHPGLGESPGHHCRCATSRRVVLARLIGREPADAGPPTTSLDDRGVSATAPVDGQREWSRAHAQAASMVGIESSLDLGLTECRARLTAQVAVEVAIAPHQPS